MALLNRDGEVIEPTSITSGAAADGGLAISPGRLDPNQR